MISAIYYCFEIDSSIYLCDNRICSVGEYGDQQVVDNLRGDGKLPSIGKTENLRKEYCKLESDVD